MENDDETLEQDPFDPSLLDLDDDPPRDGMESNEQEVVAAAAVEGLKPPIHTSYKQKLVGLLKNLLSVEVKVYSEASKEFISLLREESGGEILREYIQSSPKCTELLEAWKLRQGTPGMSHIVSLVSTVLDHPIGKSRSGGIRRNLDYLAETICTTKLNDIYDELKSKESRRQSAALSLMASVVKRGVRLATEVADNFDFKIPVLSKMAQIQKKKAGKDSGRHTKRSTRRGFVDFAVSFLEVGNPRLLRWILQQKEIYSGVLRGLGDDDAETIVYVLSTLQNKVLTKDSLVPPGLRSVLFGSATLEQLSYISGNPMAGPSAKIAHEVLVEVCTDHHNGLMPGPNLKGNEKRLLDLMKKLKATEVKYHRDLLLAIVKARQPLCAAYMDEFPYSLEPRPSSLWFSAISLAADIISSVNVDVTLKDLVSHHHDLLDPSSKELQIILKCIIPRAFTRYVINKGLLHCDFLVRHGSLRLLLESVKSLSNLFNAINSIAVNVRAENTENTFQDGIDNLHDLPGISCFESVNKYLDVHSIGATYIDRLDIEKWESLKQYIQDEVRAVLPDPQVLLKLFSSLSNKNSKHSGMSLKRGATMAEVVSKKPKFDFVGSKLDIVISGIDAKLSDDALDDQSKVRDAVTNQDLDEEEDQIMAVADIWGSNQQMIFSSETKDAKSFFHSKLLDVLTFYLRTMPMTFEGSFDFFKLLPADPLILSVDQQQSLLSLLVEYIGQGPGSKMPSSGPEPMYKHLQPLIHILIYSQVKDIQDQAYILVRAAMRSTGAFDQNLSEIDAWIFFLPGYHVKRCRLELQGAKAFHEFSSVIISFLCDAVSTIGNNLYKYLDHMRKLISKVPDDDGIDKFPGFSPLIICVLQKCLRLLEADSGTFKLYERSMISLYVCNTISLILQTQVETKLLPALVKFIFVEKDYFSLDEDSRSYLCEWRPLKNLFLFAQKLVDEQISMFSVSENTIRGKSSSFSSVLIKVKEFLEQGHGERQDEASIAFTSSIICAAPDDILANLPLVLNVTRLHFRSHLSLLSLLFFHEHNIFSNVAIMWPDMFFSGLERFQNTIKNNSRGDTENSVESASAAFSLFLEHIPFYTLFSGLLAFGSSDLHSTRMLCIVRSSNMLDLLKTKLSEGSADNFVCSLRYVLFWAYHIVLSYRAKPTDVLEELFRICFILAEYIAEHLLVTVDKAGLKIISDTDYVQVVVDIIFLHPLLTMFLSHPLSCREMLAHKNLGDSDGAFLSCAKQIFISMDNHILQFLRKILDFLLTRGSDPFRVLMVPKQLVQKASMTLQEKFNLCLMKQDLGPLLHSFRIFHTFMQFGSPFELLELVQSMLSILEHSISDCRPFLPAFPVVLYIADGALGMLFNHLQKENLKSESYLFCARRVGKFDVTILYKIYYKILDMSTRFSLEGADLCLLKMVSAVFNQRFLKPDPSVLPLHMFLSRMIINSPMKMLIHLLHHASKIKAKTLFMLAELSPLHMRFFGHMFLHILNKKLSAEDALNGSKCKVDVTDDSYNCDLSEDEFVLLLPAALSYLRSILHKRTKQDLVFFGKLSVFYSRILLDGFSDWKSYVSRTIFQEEYDEPEPASLEDFHTLFRCSLLGKAITMLHYFFIFSGSSMKKKQRLKIFDSIYPKLSSVDELFDCDLNKLNACPYKESMELINEFVAKISFTMLLLFPPDTPNRFLTTEGEGRSKDTAKEKDSDRLNCMRLRFMNVLVNALDLVVRHFPLTCTTNNSHFRFLEYYILRNIVQLSMDARSYLIRLPSIPFLNLFIRSSLLHRFEDPVTLKAIRCTLLSLSEGKFSSAEVIDLLLGHSHFVSTILSSVTVSGSVALTSSGTLLQPVPSILKSLDVSSTCQNPPKVRSISESSTGSRNIQDGLCKRKLELIKLLRVLYYLRGRQQNTGPVNVDGMKLRELLSLLLSGYSATLSEIDLESYYLMHEIELIEGSEYGSIAELDYMWGASALKIRKEQTLDMSVTSESTYWETSAERRKILFRENIPVDSKLCVSTVLHFCYDRSSRTGPLLLERLLEESFKDTEEKNLFPDNDTLYDPAFILRFSIHSLLMGYIEPVEFSRLGLLAVTFVSISSTDEELRKLGYESLGNFKKALENCRNSKDVLQLQLLLTYLQNGITEPWQKVPSVTAIFVAEASFILLDPSKDRFLTISKLMMSSPELNLKGIPLFNKLFESGSIHYKMDRLWILRLLCAGLNLSDDADIYVKTGIFEQLMSFYSSSLSDPESVVLILQITKKSVKLRKATECLVQQCGLITWLSSVILFYGERLDGDQTDFSLEVIETVLKVINDVVSSEEITDWLQEIALEQLSEFSSEVHKLFVCSQKLKQNSSLVNSSLYVMVSTLRISQKRKIHQPHFTLSLQGILQLFEAVNNEFANMGFTLTVELAINITLMSIPPPAFSHTDRINLSKLLTCAISSALWSISKRRSLTKELEPDSPTSFIDHELDESIVSKLLRWATASVILGSISDRSKVDMNFSSRSSKIKTLQSLLEGIKGEEDKSIEHVCGADEALAVSVLYLQQLLRSNCSVLPSVLSALCLLLLHENTNIRAKKFLNDNRGSISLLCSKIRCPPEANPSWKWSFYQPWKDVSVNQTEDELMEEDHACQSLLLVFSNALGGERSLGLPSLSHHDLEHSGMFEWERERNYGQELNMAVD